MSARLTPRLIPVSHRIRIVAMLAAISILPMALTRCSDATGVDRRLLLGAEITVGQGTAHTEVTVNKVGEPIDMAVVLTDGAMSGLPGTMPSTVFELPLPAEPSGTLFKHVTLNWNPSGHGPPGVFSVPHFDLHYYMITVPERDAITAADPQFAAKSTAIPASEFIPAGYTGDPSAVPRMGVHYTDPNAPERKGQPFTQSFIYGFYDGKMIFLEPMAAKSYLDSKPSLVIDLALPARYQQPGFYPTRQAVRYDAATRQYRFELLNFVARR